MEHSNSNIFMDEEEKKIKYVTYQLDSAKFCHIQMMDVGYWMSKENPAVFQEIIKNFKQNKFIDNKK